MGYQMLLPSGVKFQMAIIWNFVSTVLALYDDSWLDLQALKLGKDLEMLLKEQRSHQVEHQAEVADLTERLRLAEESREKLAVEVATLQGRFNLDLDEKTAALQEEMEASRGCFLINSCR